MKTYKFIPKLIKKITDLNQSNNDSYVFCKHHVCMQSGCPDYTQVSISKNPDPFGGLMALFSFDFSWTPCLHLFFVECQELEETIISEFFSLYGTRLEVTKELY